MATNSFTRGSTVNIASHFLNNDGSDANVLAATMTLDYTSKAGVRTQETLTMSGIGPDWSVNWDSSKARKGTVSVSITAGQAGSINVTKDSSFELTANSANVSV